MKIEALIEKERSQNPNRHILEILDNVDEEANDPEISNEIKQLRHSITQPKADEKFPRQNKAYRAIVSTIKSWQKKDFHSHISPSLSIQWIIDSVKNHWSLFEENFASHLNDEKYAEWRKKNKTSVTLNVIKALLEGKSDKEIKTMFFRYDDPEDAFDIPMLFSSSNHLDFLIDAIEYASKAYFDDGVCLVGLRLNPCKEYNGVRVDPFVLLKKVDTMLTRIEAEANKKYNRNHRVEFVCSFNQANHPKKKDWMIQTIKEAINRKAKKQTDGVDRIVGIDLSGRESDATKRSSWKELYSLIDYAKQQNVALELVCHGGDRWNICESYDLDLSKHLDYLKDAMRIKNLSRIGHANCLWPNYKFVRISAESTARKLIPNKDKSQGQAIDEILDYLSTHNVAINTLPKPEFYTIQTMKKHPFYYWKKKGIRLCVGIDGTNYIGSTLSEWIAWILLSAPLNEEVERTGITVSEMQDIVCM